MAPGIFAGLRDVLMKGGEIATGIGVFYGWGREKLGSMISTRFGLGEPQIQQNLIDFATRGVTAANIIRTTNQIGLIGIDDIPVNPYLFGDEPEGRRGRYVGEFQLEPDGRWYRIDVDVADFENLEQLDAYVADEAFRRIGDSPGAFGVAAGVVPVIFDIRIIFVERKF